ncbi:MAG: iron-containing alcohol dehydrogenase [Promethearchaeota archaeon]
MISMRASGIEFAFNSPRVIFGAGSAGKLPDLVVELSRAEGERTTGKLPVMLCAGHSLLRQEALRAAWEGREDLELIVFTKPPGEPTVEAVEAGTKLARESGVRVVVGVGGGSVLDVAKAIAGMLTNPGRVSEYQDGRPFPNRALPFVAVPTTAGTGSEVSNNAVLIDPERGLKASVRGENLRARLAVVDPLLTYTAPPEVTAHSGMDALTQAIEAYTSRAANFISDAFAELAIPLLAGNLQAAYQDGTNAEARSGMALGSLMSGLAFSNAKLGAVHGFAHPLGARFGIPHGLVCAVLLPHVMAYNLPVVTEKYARLADLFVRGGFSTSLLGDPPKANVEDKARWTLRAVGELLASLKIPSNLSQLGVSKEHADEIVGETKGGSLANNPRDTSPESLKQILLEAIGE